MSERYFTVVLKVPEGWKPGPEFTGNEYFTAGSWSHAIHERDYARAALASTRTASEPETDQLVGAMYALRYIAAGGDDPAKCAQSALDVIARLESSSTASDTRTAAGEAECDAAVPAAPAVQHDADAVGEVAERYGRLLAEKRNADAARGFAQGVEYYIVDGIHRAIAELASRGAAQGRITQSIEPPRYAYGDDGKVTFLNPMAPRDFAAAGSAEVDVEAERKLFEAWAGSEQFDLRRPHKTYHNTCTSYAWQGWLAARTQADAGKDALRTELLRLRDWFEAQAKVISKGGGSTWDMAQCREQIESIDATTKPENL